MAKDKDWLENGLQFQCQGSGQCCVSRGEYGFVYLTREDRKNLAKAVGLSPAVFTRKYCQQSEDGTYFIKPSGQQECIFLSGNRCEVYEARPIQCRTWPFWPENMNPRAWKKEVVKFCPGASKGKTYSKKEIEKILEQQTKAEREIFGE